MFPNSWSCWTDTTQVSVVLFKVHEALLGAMQPNELAAK